MWHVRRASGEVELTLEQLQVLVVKKEVQRRDYVRSPVTKRWKFAENAPELDEVFALKTEDEVEAWASRVLAQREEAQRLEREKWIREAPLREREEREQEARAREYRRKELAKKVITLAIGIPIVIIIIVIALSSGGGGTNVRGYTRKDGTAVKSHQRSR